MVTILALKRRSIAEQKILPLLRGEDLPGVTSAQRRLVCDLGQRARQSGMTILPAGSRFVGRDELVLLGWLASAQRPAPASSALPGDPYLADLVRRCAERLGAMGLHLPAVLPHDPRRAGS